MHPTRGIRHAIILINPLYKGWARNKIEPKGEIIWNKGFGQAGTAWGSFCSASDPALEDQHEYILVFRKFANRQKPESFDKISFKDFRVLRNSMWNIPPAKASKVGHVAPFPIEIPSRLIVLSPLQGRNSSRSFQWLWYHRRGVYQA